jgi:site-specific recombinase XerC
MTSDGSPRPISPLRARMIEDMTVRGFSEKTRHDYVRKVRAFAAFIGRSPDTATAEDLRLFQLHQRQSGMQPPSINSAVSALRFFFTATLDRPDLARRLTIVPYPRRIPAVLSVEEVTLLLQAASAPKYKAAFALAYGAGLRVSEVVALKVGDIDSKRMLLRVERGKGGKSLPSRKRGPPRHAVAAAARTFACLVARGAAAQPVVAGRLAISRPQPGRAALGPPALPRCPRRRPGRRDQQARLATHLAAQLRHTPS